MTSLFEFDEVCYQYRKDRLPALNGLSFQIPVGARTAIIGPNGAGKSTLIFHMNGLYGCGSGKVSYLGEELTKERRRQMPGRVGVVFQDPDDQLIALTVAEDIAFGPQQQGLQNEEVQARVQASIDLLGIADLADLNPAELSFGQKKQAAVAGVLAMHTDVVIFDEPMAFLDPAGKRRMREIMELLGERGQTVIVATHDMQFVAEWAEHVVVMADGQCLAAMTPQQLFTQHSGLMEAANLELPTVAEVFTGLWKDEATLPIRVSDARARLEQLIAAGWIR
ncbi:energy-coupling factor ABC transporter ATP-binding protein [Paenibacillus sp. GCM10023252]|uniref:energy-coupling factor ABC transporter ATP-binding protein n=1 Tax=Paenibacillus sp. GCM10023252 TaxID=3252649 RepID=UPI00361F172F